MSKITFRENVSASDVDKIKDMCVSTGFFNDEEVEIAVELVKDRIMDGIKTGYLFIFAEIEGKTVGYSCYGPISGTTDSYDLYWIVTHNDYRGQGIGKLLLSETENKIAEAGGNGIYAETASKPQYEPTRMFYEKNSYILEARLKDFYAPKDDKLIYVKRIKNT